MILTRQNQLNTPAATPTSFAVVPRDVLSTLQKHVLVDGFKIVIDTQKSRGSTLVDAATGRQFIDFYSFYASQPVGYNHPHFFESAVEADLLRAARIKVANSDMYSTQYAGFVETFARVMGLPPLERYFFIEGGALAVENALKVAMDWKVRLNLAAGRGERGTQIIHFTGAFHGRSGYTMSLTNTDPKKVQYFARFDWPRIPAPFINFALGEDERERDAARREQEAERRIQEVLSERRHDIAAMIIEPIQGEGGDRHFRREWFQTMRRICDQHEILLIFDEVQTGMGITGGKWCCEHFAVLPDVLAFGKKSQVCGIMGGPRVDEVKDNCLRLPGRISSTWGGNFTDYVRSTHYLRIIEQENLIKNARRMGDHFLDGLRELAARHPAITAVRGRGLMLAFDLPDAGQRDQFWKGAYEHGLLVIRSGERSIRLRGVLDVTTDVIDQALLLMNEQCRRMNL